jgi:hypothetical protein
MHPVLIAVFSTFGGFLAASSGWWTYLRTRQENEEAHIKLLMGLAQDKITHLGMKYIERGWVTNDEYTDLRRYLYEPYVELGGNGTSERIMYAVERLPIHTTALDGLPIRNTDRMA